MAGVGIHFLAGRLGVRASSRREPVRQPGRSARGYERNTPARCRGGHPEATPSPGMGDARWRRMPSRPGERRGASSNEIRWKSRRAFQRRKYQGCQHLIACRRPIRDACSLMRQMQSRRSLPCRILSATPPMSNPADKKYLKLNRRGVSCSRFACRRQGGLSFNVGRGLVRVNDINHSRRILEGRRGAGCTFRSVRYLSSAKRSRIIF
jgi:hypothetical protein